jgi:hypothetical protein
LHTFPSNIGSFFLQNATSSLSEQLCEWNQRGCKGHQVYYQSDPCIALAKPMEINRTCVFHPFLENTPPPPAMVNLACSRCNWTWA